MDIILHIRALPAGEAVKLHFTALDALFGGSPVMWSRASTNLQESIELYQPNNAANLARVSPSVTTAIEKFTEQSHYLQLKTVASCVQINNTRIGFEYITDDGITARLRFYAEQRQHPQEQVAVQLMNERGGNWAGVLSQIYNLTTKSEIAGSMLPQIEQEKLKYQEQAMSNLAAAIAKLQSLSATQIHEQSQYFDRRNQELDAELARRDEERQRVFAVKNEALEAERTALINEKNEIDLRKATIARRKLLTDLTTMLNSEFRVSEATVKMRFPIVGACTLGMSVGIILCAFGAILLGHDQAMAWHYWPIFASGTVLFGSTLIFYLRWNDAWFNKLAESEFYTRKLKIDALRSSWLAEMVLEWSDEKGGKEFPPQLLTSFTTGLFQTGRDKRTEHHPIGQLLQTVGQFESLKVTKDGLELKQKEK